MRTLVLILMLLIAFVPQAQASGTNAERHGIAVYYNPGVMERVAAYRGLTKPLIADGMAAVTDCGQIGKIAFASINGGLIERYLIVDCAQTRDRDRQMRAGLVLEVDYQSAVRNKFNREGHAQAVVYSIGGSVALGDSR